MIRWLIPALFGLWAFTHASQTWADIGLLTYIIAMPIAIVMGICKALGIQSNTPQAPTQGDMQ